MSDEDLLKLAIDDIRARQDAVYDLVLSQDKQAMELLRLYVTVGLAVASGAVAMLSNPDRFPLGVGLLCGLVALVVGIVFCFRATWQAQIAFSGRDAKFWEWASHPSITTADLQAAYFKAADENLKTNRRLNVETAREYWIAKWCGVASPILIAFVGLAVFLGKY